MRTAKLKRRLTERFGRVPDSHYFSDDMEGIRGYYDYRASQGQEDFLLDGITWNDLDMERVFRRINPRLSTAGEQYLYYMLRSPAVTEDVWCERKRAIDFASADPARRLLGFDDELVAGAHARADRYLETGIWS